MALAAHLFSDLNEVRGAVIWPHDPAYEQARTVWNGAVDRWPAVIVRCADAADVGIAVSFARRQGLPIAVRSGGHCMAGHGTCDSGVVIDLSAMTGIATDPARRVARLEPGLTWGAVAAALQPHGLALTSGDTASVGVGGLTLGGGIGWMARKYGLTIDHLRSVELVTAAGEILTASAADHPGVVASAGHPSNIPNRLLNDSARVGWAKMPSRSAV
jgi:FAD/FMN-containing dehydrogenase